MLIDALKLLDRLISTPSLSRQEGETATVIQQWLHEHGIVPHRVLNNVYAVSTPYDPEKPTVLLDAHHDTVRPALSYSLDPYKPLRRDDRIYGLGSNDDGGSLVALVSTFCLCNSFGRPLPFNLIFSATAEEEVSGEGGMRALLPELYAKGYRIDMAIVGEPTQMQPAIAERGLMVLDCTAHGVTGHAARNEGINALYRAVDCINTLRDMRFERVSPTLGPIKLTVTQIQAGRQHNVVPEECSFVVDVRTTDAYTNEETEQLIANAIGANTGDVDVKARSHRIRASVIAQDHPLVLAATSLGLKPYVSPTTSNMALMPDFPTLKIGPGDSARSHTADEYICVSEIIEAIDLYTKILTNLKV